MKAKTNISLKSYNTFGIDVCCSTFIEIKNPIELAKILRNNEDPFMVLGGGSNILLTDDYHGLIIKNSIKGFDVIEENSTHVWLKIGAGEVWHDVVMKAIENDWGGIENLSLIPGTMGAAPMQNIGAYGIEIKSIFHSLEALNVNTQKTRTFNSEECKFGYRESIFKHEAKGKYIITYVTLKLTKVNHSINIAYGAIKDTLIEREIDSPTIKDVSDAVISIRQSKLPDPREIGNAGSFFKNPTISKEDYDQLKSQFDNIPGYLVGTTQVKVPAGWLIEQCGWKGYVKGNIGVHKNQALVLVNYGGGKGSELKSLSEEIQQSVKNRFGIELSTEVNIV